MTDLFPAGPVTGRALQRRQPGALQPDQLERACQLRNLAVAAELDCPRYLLAPEISRLLSYVPDLHQRTLIETLWNTGGRIREVLALTKGDFYFDADTPFVVLRTSKQRRQPDTGTKNKGGTAHKRAVPLFDPQYVSLMKSYFTTMRFKNQSLIWPVRSDNTVRNWIREAAGRAEEEGFVSVVSPVTCHTFRHSFAMHLIFHGVPMKMIQAYLGHKKSSSTDIYTRIFTLDAMMHFEISFR